MEITVVGTVLTVTFQALLNCHKKGLMLRAQFETEHPYFIKTSHGAALKLGGLALDGGRSLSTEFER